MNHQRAVMEGYSRIALVAPGDTRRITSLSASTIRRLVEAGQFPRPIVLSRNRHGKPVRIAYVLSELEEWCAQRIAASRASPVDGLERQGASSN